MLLFRTDDLTAIRLNLHRQHALISDRFRIAIEAQLGRRAGPATTDRTRKTCPGDESPL